MPTVRVFNQLREEVSSVDLREEIFGVEVKEHLFHLMVRYQLAKRRAGTHATKGRTQRRGGGRKPYRQKGTGRARQGTIRAPQYRKGGVVFGPTPRSHAIAVPKKVRRAALLSALSRRVEDEALWVLDQLKMDEVKTKSFAEIVSSFGWLDGEVLIVLPEADDTIRMSARNIPGVKVLSVDGLNVYDILKHRHLVLTIDALGRINQRLGS